MATIIDALLVTLKLDPKEYLAGKKRVEEGQRDLTNKVEKSGRDITDANRKVADSFTGVKREAVSLFATIVGANGIKDYIAQTVTQFSNLDRAAKAAGLSVKDFSAFGQVIARNGGNAQTAQAGISSLAAQLYQWKTLGIASQQLIGASQLIGFGANDNALQVFEKFTKWAQGRNPQQVQQFGQMLGLDEASINEAMKGLKAYREELAKAKASAPSDKDAKAVKDLQAAWVGLGNDIRKPLNDLVVSGAPVFADILRSIDGLVQKMPLLVQGLAAVGVALTALSGLSVVEGLLGLFGGGAAVAGAGEAAAGGAGLLGGAAIGIEGGAMLGLGASAGVAAFAYGGGLGNSDIKSTGAVVASREAYIRNYFKAKGLSDSAINGIVAGMKAENGTLDPNAKNPNSSAYGLGQWLTKRQKDFPGEIHGSSMGAQLDFMWSEWQGKEKGAFDAIKGGDASSAANAYITRYMRPAPGAETISDLQRASRNLGGSAAPTINIDSLNVNTPSNDPMAHARAINEEMQRQLMAAQANSGLNG